MPETLDTQVLAVVDPADVEADALQPGLRELAAERYVLVCRKGGRPSRLERVKAFVLRRPIEAVTLVADTAPEEGADVTARVEETDMVGVYDVTRFE
ncbi:DUF7526 family protein [Halobacterium yunchengense]|uniref:DUF7526 family protein n=1 Tax=Halobacterium yunchengense TaxID=3108497 RepID=UPI00300A4B57